jgi:enamine deaminase RidA (YjgF/YER057c/UK114 family)
MSATADAQSQLGPAFAARQVVRRGEQIFIGSTGDVGGDRDPESQARRCLQSIVESLRAIDTTREDIVRTWIWLRHPGLAEPVARAFNSVLGDVRPTVSQLVVNGFLDPLRQVEIEAEAIIAPTAERQSLRWRSAPPAALRNLNCSRAIRLGERVLVSLTGPRQDADGFYDHDPGVQARQCLNSARDALQELDASLDDAVVSRFWMADPADGPVAANVHTEVFESARPTFTQVVVGHTDPGVRVAIELEAGLGPDRQYVRNRRNPNSSRSRAVRWGNRVFVSCTAPIIDPGHRTDPDPLAQMNRCWEVITEALKAAGAVTEDVVRCRFFIRHRADGEVVARFTQEALARARPTIAVLAIHGYLDPSWRVEIEAEAMITK